MRWRIVNLFRMVWVGESDDYVEAVRIAGERERSTSQKHIIERSY